MILYSRESVGAIVPLKFVCQKAEGEFMKYYLAVDIGASSGRHIIGYEKDGEIFTDELYRFYNGMDNVDGNLYWDTERLLEEVIVGIGKCFEKYPKI